MEGTESGWPGFFRILRLYLTHFKGQRSAIMQWNAMPAGTAEDAWATLTAALGMKGVGAGQRYTAPAGVPPLGGVVEPADKYPQHVMLRLDKPCPGVADFGAAVCTGTVMVTVSFYLYGDQAAAIAARDRPQWEAWMQKHFPMPAQEGKSE